MNELPYELVETSNLVLPDPISDTVNCDAVERVTVNLPEVEEMEILFG